MVPVAVPMTVSAASFVKTSENDTFEFLGAPPSMRTVIGWVVTPGAKVSVPDVAT